MTDPRQTLAHTTLTHVYSAEFQRFPIRPRTTHTPLDQPRLVPEEGLYKPVSQDPRVEGELIIFYDNSYGVRVAIPYVAVEINGALEWKLVSIVSSVTRFEDRFN